MMSLLVAWVMIGITLAVVVALVVAVRSFLWPVKETRPVELSEWLEYCATQRSGAGRPDAPVAAQS